MVEQLYDGKPVRTCDVSKRLKISRVKTFDNLAIAEREGLVCRPNGRRNGWVPQGDEEPN